MGRQIRGSVTYKTHKIVLTGNYTVVNDSLVIVKKTVGAATAITLPAPIATNGRREVIIVDGLGDALTNNITVTTASGTINGAANHVINENFGAMRYIDNGTQWQTALQASTSGVVAGTGAAGKAIVLDANGHTTIPGELELDGNTMAVGAGTGITAGTGTLYKAGVIKVGGIIKTSILIDLTGLASSTTDLDIIGVGAGVAHIGQITAARNGTILGGKMTCLEVPTGGADDIDLYFATEGTGVFDGAVTDLTETVLITTGGAWTLGLQKGIADFVASANKFLYLAGGEAGTAATYTAGKFLIELYGYDA